MAPKLVDDAKSSWKWFSMQAMTLAGAIQAAWLYIPEDMKASISTTTVSYITMGLLVFGIIGRLYKQGD